MSSEQETPSEIEKLRERIKFLEQEIVHYVNNPGCNGPAKKKAIQRLMAAVIQEESK